MTTANRDALLSLMTLVRPAIASQSFIPAWTHIRLADGSATTFNDTASVTVKLPFKDLASVCVPGELFIKALSSFNSETVLIQEDGEGEGHIGWLLLTSGRSKMKVPVLPVADFKMPTLKGSPVKVSLTDEILDGIKQCLFSVGADPTHPAQMGVTLNAVNGLAVLCSTDNITLSRFATKSKLSLPGDAPVVLPTFFCEQLLTLAKAYPDDDMTLEVYSGAVQVKFGNAASMLTKALVDTEPLDFEDVFSKYLNVADVKKTLIPLPAGFDASFNRALLVQGKEVDKSVRVTVSKAGNVELFSKSALGESDDSFEVGCKVDAKPFHVDPALVLRAAKSCGSVAFLPRVLLLGSDDGAFIHLVAHCAG